MGDQIKRAINILLRLCRDQAGNTMAIVAAAIFPLAALIGGGVDMSRAYMTRARLQQACDAAALAGRRAMTTSSMTETDKAEAKRFFDFNFPEGTMGTGKITPTIQSNPNETTTVQVSASTTIPTTIMRIFGYENLPLTVSCDSRFDIGNTDVMMVLDTTGSMLQSISDGNGGTTTRIAALQQAVKDFYDALGPGDNATGRIRYGFVPYSSAVNVGYQVPTDALVGGTAGETADYYSRRMTYYNNTPLTTPASTICYRKYKSSSSSNSCRSTLGAAENDSGNGRTPSQCRSWGNAAATFSGSAPSNITKITYSAETWNGTSPVPSTGSQSKSCVRRETTTTHTTGYTAGTGWSEYKIEYGKIALPVSSYITGNAVANPTRYSSSTTDVNGSALPTTITWSGCIEERQTDSSITAATSTSSIPATAFDLQIDTAPTNTATRWRPHLPQLEFRPDGRWLNDNREFTSSNDNDWYRASTGGWNACPSQARRLTSYASRTIIPTGQTSSFDDYVDGLVAIGGTYHDIGMVWGARFLSPTGIFAADNATAPNGFAISRHIVFMTDGAMSAYQKVYGSYGYQLLDGRVAPTTTDNAGLTAIHNRRLEMLCNEIQGMNITIWVVAFAEGYTTQVQNCATSANHRTFSTDAQTLRDTFKSIAKNIGGLRLSK